MLCDRGLARQPLELSTRDLFLHNPLFRGRYFAFTHSGRANGLSGLAFLATYWPADVRHLGYCESH
jgi:hypothetical protein